MAGTSHTTRLGAPTKLGYSRAVSAGNLLITSATAPMNDQREVVGGDDAYAQTTYAFDKLRPLLAEAGYSFADVIHIRFYSTDSADMGEISRALRTTFGEIAPAAAFVHVLPFPVPGLRVEVELTAVRETPPA